MRAGAPGSRPQLQRMRSEDLLRDRVPPIRLRASRMWWGERDVPRHPLVDQTIDDCLHDAMDCDAWIALLRRIEKRRGAACHARFTRAVAVGRLRFYRRGPYAFLDDAPIEERRNPGRAGARLDRSSIER